MDQGPDVSHRQGLSLQTKLRVAQWIRFHPVRWLMRLAILVVVPRHRIGVAMVLRDDRGRILMLRHVFHPVTPWGLPGGWLNRHEEPRAGVLRELREETGLQAELGPLIFTEYAMRPRRIEMAFLGTVIPGPITLSGEIIEACWFEPAALPEKNAKTYGTGDCGRVNHSTITMNRQSSPGIGQWLTVIITVGVLLFLIYQLWQYGQVRDRLPAGFAVANINVGGQTLEQASEIISNRYEDAPVVLWFGEQRIEIAPADAEFQLDLERMLRDADYERSQQDFWAGFWGFLWDRPVEVEEVPLYATHNRDTLMDTLEAIASNLNSPAQPPQPVPTSLSFQYGTSGSEVDVLGSLADVEAAFYRAESREARLLFHNVEAERPDINLLARLIVNHVQEFEQDYGGVATIFIMDLGNGAEINYRANVPMSGMHLLKLPIALETYQVLSSSPTPDEDAWLNETLLDVTSPGPNNLLSFIAGQADGVADAYRGTEILTTSMSQLGLYNTFMVTPYEQQPLPARRTVATPANSQEILDTIPDPLMQTTAEDMGLLLAMLYYCAQNGGGTLQAVFPEQITPTECQQILATMQQNNIDSLIEQGAPAATVIAHRHGWISDTHADAGIVYSPGGDYVIVVMMYKEGWLEWEVSSPLLADIARAAYNYFNFDAPFMGSTP